MVAPHWPFSREQRVPVGHSKGDAAQWLCWSHADTRLLPQDRLFQTM